MVRVPRILIVVPGILAGIFVPSLLVATPRPTPPNTADTVSVGMVNMDFSVDVVKLHVGERIVFVDSSHNIHDIGPGNNGQITSPVPGDPVTGFHLMTTNSGYTTGPWLTPGKYYLTCGIHPTMNLTVVVVR